MTTTLSGTHTGTYTLSSTAGNPFTITSNATFAADASSVFGAIFGPGNSGQSWTVTNAGVLSGGTQYAALQLGAGAGGGASVFTNQSGGTLSGHYGIYIFDTLASTITNLAGGTISAPIDTGNGAAVNITGPATVNNFGIILAPSQYGWGIHAVANSSGGTFVPNTVFNGASGTISGARAVYLANGGTVTNNGTIEAGSASAYAVFIGGTGATDRLAVGPGAVFFGKVRANSGATLELASGASAGTLTATNFTGFTNIQFDAGAQWTLAAGSAALAGTIASLSAGNTIDVLGFTASSAGGTAVSGTPVTIAGGTSLTLTGTGTVTTEVLKFATSVSSFIVSSGTFGTNVTTICFCPGTKIRRPGGETEVEHLSIGDTVVTLGGTTEKIVWIGKGKVLATRGKRGPATPVIVRKGALADNVPNEDLRVTKGHALYFDGALIPVEFLVNHKSILWDDRAQEVEIYHIELAHHDVLFANGAPAESYRDDGNRWLFQNANEGWGQPEKPHFAPVLTGGPPVDAVWRRLLDRAGGGSTVPKTEDSDLHLVVDGVRVDAVVRQDRKLTFRMPPAPSSVRIVSRDGVPAELGLVRDPRSLGVALRRVAVWQGRHVRVIEAQDERLNDGFHDYEAEDGIRWTDGDAALPAEVFAGLGQDALVELHLGGATVYPLVEAGVAA